MRATKPQSTNRHELTQQPGGGAYDEPDGERVDAVAGTKHHRRHDHDQIERNALHRRPEPPTCLRGGSEEVCTRYQDGRNQHDAGERSRQLGLSTLKPGASTVTTSRAASAMISEPRPRTTSVTVSTTESV